MRNKFFTDWTRHTPFGAGQALRRQTAAARLNMLLLTADISQEHGQQEAAERAIADIYALLDTSCAQAGAADFPAFLAAS